MRKRTQSPSLKSFLSVTFVFVGLLFPVSASASWLHTGSAVLPPVGFIKFCVENMDDCLNTMAVKPGENNGQVVLDQDKWNELRGVHEDVNAAFKPVYDVVSVGFNDDWSYGRDGLADCEDYALIKRQALLEKGWPAEALLLTTAMTERGEYHVVLTVVTDRGEVVLDNRFALPRPVDTLDYQWVSRQDPQNPLRWVSVISDTGTSQYAALGQQQ